jgi:hypothetical protein
VSSTRTAACLFCRRAVPVRFPTGTVQLDCPDCGWYEVTTGAIELLRSDEHANAAVRAEVRRELDSGVERPQINLWLIKELKGR